MKRAGATRPIAVLIALFSLPELVAMASGETLNLIYKSIDLVYPVQDLGGTALQTGQKDNRLNEGSSALKSEVLDLKNAGAEVEESDTEVKISLQGEILFDFDKANVRPAAEPVLTQIAALIQKQKKPSVLIEGYTDAKGSAAYNAKLSDRRATAVKTWLTAHAIGERTMKTHGWGAAKPVAPNKKPDGSDDPEGRQKNRRVEITIKK